MPIADPFIKTPGRWVRPKGRLPERRRARDVPGRRALVAQACRPSKGPPRISERVDAKRNRGPDEGGSDDVSPSLRCATLRHSGRAARAAFFVALALCAPRIGLQAHRRLPMLLRTRRALSVPSP